MDVFHWSEIKVGEYAKTRMGIGMITDIWRDYNGWKIELLMEEEKVRLSFSLSHILCLSKVPEALELLYTPDEQNIRCCERSCTM